MFALMHQTILLSVCKKKLCLKLADGLVPQQLSLQCEQTAVCQTAVPAAGPLLTVSDGTPKLLTHIC